MQIKARPCILYALKHVMQQRPHISYVMQHVVQQWHVHGSDSGHCLIRACLASGDMIGPRGISVASSCIKKKRRKGLSAV